MRRNGRSDRQIVISAKTLSREGRELKCDIGYRDLAKGGDGRKWHLVMSNLADGRKSHLDPYGIYLPSTVFLRHRYIVYVCIR